MSLKLNEIKAGVVNKEILQGLSLEINAGEVVVLMGPNGSGKSSLANVVMGNPIYEMTSGEIELDGKSIKDLSVDERARAGLMMAFQYPVSISGVNVREMLLSVIRQRGEKITALELKRKVEEEAKNLGIDSSLLSRGLNEDFSGGEKKRLEVLQIKILKPKYVILDETDSGLDIDALKMVATQVRRLVETEKLGVLVITHYQRLLKYLKPDRVIVMKKGRVVAEGRSELVERLENGGYEAI